MDQFKGLVEALKAFSPNDVLLPVARGEKRPMFPHSSGRWTWAKLSEFIAGLDGTEEGRKTRAKKQVEYDACVCLHDLCVVDVDTLAQAEQLEARFPALLSVPCELTKRGKHYWFRRSSEADLHGFYDGAAQKEHGIDFKSRCRSGTSGIVVVAPSSGKRWVPEREFRSDLLVDIPFDLLVTIAVPKHRTVTRKFKFEPFVEESVLTTATLDNFDYFEPFMRPENEEEDDGNEDEEAEEGLTSDTIFVPCTKQEFERVDKVLRRPADFFEERDVRDNLPAILRTADKLGVKHDLRRKILAGAALWHTDLCDKWPEMAESLDVERAWLVPEEGTSASTNTDGICLPVDEAIHYVPPPFLADEQCLFHYSRPVHDAGECVVAPWSSEGFEDMMRSGSDAQAIVISLLKEHPLVLAGGAVLGMLAFGVEDGADFDLFVHGLDEAQADAMLEAVEEKYFAASEGWQTVRTSRAVTYIRKKNERLAVVQIILRLYDTPQQVPLSFDIAASRVAVWYEAAVSGKGSAGGQGGSAATGKNSSYVEDVPPDGNGDFLPAFSKKAVIMAAPSWFIAMKHRAFAVDVRHWNRASVSRIFKYAKKGFDVLVPGVRRAFLGDTVHVPKRGLAGVFYVEGRLFGFHPQHFQHCPLALKTALDRVATCASDYEDRLKASSSFAHVLNAMLAFSPMLLVGKLFLRSSPSLTPSQKNSKRLVLWHRFGVGSAGASSEASSVMSPEPPRMWAVHEDREGFEAIATDALNISENDRISVLNLVKHESAKLLVASHDKHIVKEVVVRFMLQNKSFFAGNSAHAHNNASIRERFRHDMDAYICGDAAIRAWVQTHDRASSFGSYTKYVDLAIRVGRGLAEKKDVMAQAIGVHTEQIRTSVLYGRRVSLTSDVDVAACQAMAVEVALLTGLREGIRWFNANVGEHAAVHVGNLEVKQGRRSKDNRVVSFFRWLCCRKR